MSNSGGGLPRDAGKLDPALPLGEETLQLKKAYAGRGSPRYPDKHEQPGGGLLRRRQAGPRPAAPRGNAQAREGQAGGRSPPTCSWSMNNLTGLRRRAKLDLALPLYAETLKLRKAKLGADHPDTLITMANLALGQPERREVGPGPVALLGGPKTAKGQVGGRPSRHAQHHDQPGGGLSRGREVGPGLTDAGRNTEAQEGQAGQRDHPDSTPLQA